MKFIKITFFCLLCVNIGYLQADDLEPILIDSVVADNYYKGKERSKKNSSSFQLLAPMDPAYYLGFGGVMGCQNLTNTIRESTTSGDTGSKDTDRSSTRQSNPGIGFIGLAGYRLNPIMSFELFYFQYAWDQKQTLKKSHDTDRLGLSYTTITKTNQLQFGPRSLFFLPINRYFMPYAIIALSFQYWYQKINYTGNLQPDGTEAQFSWGTYFNLGYGIATQFADHFSIRFETMAPPENVAGTQTVNLILIYSF